MADSGVATQIRMCTMDWSTRATLVRRCTLVLTFLISSPTAVSAQAVGPAKVFGEYQQLYWQEQNGLPQNTVLTITTTRDGYLWLGTYEGAVGFDGTRFAVFRPANTPQIGNQQVSGLPEDSAANLWLATFDGGLTRLSSGRFTRYTTRDGLSSDLIPLATRATGRRPRVALSGWNVAATNVRVGWR